MAALKLKTMHGLIFFFFFFPPPSQTVINTCENLTCGRFARSHPTISVTYRIKHCKEVHRSHGNEQRARKLVYFETVGLCLLLGFRCQERHPLVTDAVWSLGEVGTSHQGLPLAHACYGCLA